MRQAKLMAEAEQTTPAHIEQIMKGGAGFTMNDMKGLQRNYSDDGVEMDEPMPSGSGRLSRQPTKPPRKGSVSRNTQYDQGEFHFM